MLIVSVNQLKDPCILIQLHSTSNYIQNYFWLKTLSLKMVLIFNFSNVGGMDELRRKFLKIL